MKQKVNHTARSISNDISAAEDTGNVDALLAAESRIHAAMMTGLIDINDAAGLQADLDIARDAIGTVDSHTDHVRHALTEAGL